MTHGTGVAIYFGLLAATVALFWLAPQIDPWFSGLFYIHGRGFVLQHWPPIVFVFHAVPWIAWGIAVVIAGAAAWLILTGRPLWRLDRKALLFVALSTVLGPGLLANTVLKDHWGRARPVQIEAFGGTRRFTAAPVPARQCATNCSFVSGHAALGFSLVAFAFLLPPGPTRRRAAAGMLTFGGLIGLVRIAQGGHFLSDVVFAGFLVVGTAALLYWWVVERDAFAAAPLRRLYRQAEDAAASGWQLTCLGWPRPAVRIGVAVTGTAILVVVSLAFADQPVALYFHVQSPEVHALFNWVAELGASEGWLALFGVGFVALHWGGAFPRLRPLAPRMRALSPIPAFLFMSIAASGLLVDLMKVGFGRMRPKLLFSHDLYGFTWFALRADHWSFPSGHTTTFVALMTALWCLWPRHLLFYVLAGAIVAAARVIGGAHYPSDVMAAVLIAVLTTRYLAMMFARGGIDLVAARVGEIGSGEVLPWPCRYFRGVWAARRMPPDRVAGQSLAPRVTSVVSARHHAAADRDV